MSFTKGTPKADGILIFNETPLGRAPLGEERCTRCGVPPAAWRVELTDGRLFCSDFCARQLAGEADALLAEVERGVG